MAKIILNGTTYTSGSGSAEKSIEIVDTLAEARNVLGKVVFSLDSAHDNYGFYEYKTVEGLNLWVKMPTDVTGVTVQEGGDPSVEGQVIFDSETDTFKVAKLNALNELEWQEVGGSAQAPQVINGYNELPADLSELQTGSYMLFFSEDELATIGASATPPLTSDEVIEGILTAAGSNRKNIEIFITE